MQKTLRSLLLCSVTAAGIVFLASAQDAPSLGDVARKSRQEKQGKDAQNKNGQTAKKPRVITDEEVAHSVLDDQPAAAKDQADAVSAPSTPAGTKLAPEEWRSRIEAQKKAVASLQDNIEKLDQSIQFAPGNCVAGCVEWNQRQKEKQAEVERMREQLKQQQKQLENMQEAARQQGYGSSITDP
jgi:hypothetical protein